MVCKREIQMQYAVQKLKKRSRKETNSESRGKNRQKIYRIVLAV